MEVPARGGQGPVAHSAPPELCPYCGVRLDTRTAQALAGTAAVPQLTMGDPLAIPVEPPVARLWYYEISGQAMGPVPEAEIRNLLQAGRIGPQTLVWCEDLGSWIPASRVAAFSS